jgi:hypothetical protein
MLQNAKHAKRKLNEVQVWCLRCQTQRNCCWKKSKIQTQWGNADTNSKKNSIVKCKHLKKKHRYTNSKWWEKP